MPEGGDGVALEVRDSVPLWLAFFVVSVMLAIATAPVPGWGGFLVLLSGWYAAFAAFRLAHRPPRLRITDTGIIDRTYWFSPGLIPWVDIVDVRPTRWGLIDIDLRDEAAFWERLTPLQKLGRIKTQLYGFGPAVVIPYFLARSRRSLIETMRSGLDAFTVAEARRAKGPEAGARR